MNDVIQDLKNLLESAGFGVAVGADAVIEKMIDLAPAGGSQKLCSGYGVFPDGERCEGCKDCRHTPEFEDGPEFKGWEERSGGQSNEQGTS